MRRTNTSGPVRDAKAFQELVRAWETAYRDYMAAWEHGSRVLSPGASLNTANAARRVSLAWHELAKSRGLPWWCVAALESAAEGFAELAQDWASKADGDAASGRRVRRDVDGRVTGFGDGGGNRAASGQSADAGRVRHDVGGVSGAADGRDRMAGMRGVPSPAPRRGGRPGGAAGCARGDSSRS
jgi:hypothetical protein